MAIVLPPTLEERQSPAAARAIDLIVQRVMCAAFLQDLWKRSVQESRVAAAKMRRSQQAAAKAVQLRGELLKRMREQRRYEL